MTVAENVHVRDGLFWMSPRIVIESRRQGNDVHVLDSFEVGASLVLDTGSASQPVYYLVTARHVVEDAEAGQSSS